MHFQGVVTTVTHAAQRVTFFRAAQCVRASERGLSAARKGQISQRSQFILIPVWSMCSLKHCSNHLCCESPQKVHISWIVMQNVRDCNFSMMLLNVFNPCCSRSSINAAPRVPHMLLKEFWISLVCVLKCKDVDFCNLQDFCGLQKLSLSLSLSLLLLFHWVSRFRYKHFPGQDIVLVKALFFLIIKLKC